MRQVKCPECGWVSGHNTYPLDIQDYHQHYMKEHAPRPLVKDTQP